jgi:hypothetical protein
MSDTDREADENSLCTGEMLPKAAKLEYLCYTPSMKLSQYAKQQGISYRIALRWGKAVLANGYQSPTGAISVRGSENCCASRGNLEKNHEGS